MHALRSSTLGRWLVSVVATALVLTGASLLGSPAAYATPNPIAVTMTAAPNPVSSGSSLTYAITTTNIEPQVTNVRLSDQLTGLKNVVLTSSRGYCTESNLLVTCDAGSMPGQSSTWTVTITGVVTAGDGTYLDNTATVTANWSAQNTGQDYAVPATARVLVGNQPSGPQADLSTSITAPSTAAPGAAVAYTVTVNNTGGSNATDVLATATLPPGFGIGSVNGTSLFSCSAAAPTVTCRGGAVNAGANATITINATASATTPAAGQTLTYKTTAVVDPENAIPESNDNNNTSSHTLSVPAAPAPKEPMVFTKTAASSVDPSGAQARPGDQLTYTLTVKNTGTTTGYKATRLQVTDGTQGLDAASVTATSSDPGLVCTPASTQVKCVASNNNYTLQPGAQVVITIKGKVVQPPSSIITNTATMQALQNKVSITRTASVTTVVRPGIDLTVTNRATCPAVGAPSLLPCPPFRARSQFDYLVTVGNSGLDDATGVVVRIPLASGVIFEGYDNVAPSGGFTCSVDANNVVTCSGGTVPGALSSGQGSGTTRQLRLHLTAPNATGPITATTTVDPYNAIPESDETNNTFQTTTPIETGIDLAVSQAVRCPRDTRSAPLMCDPAAPSGTVIYDIVVQNPGSQDAGAIKVTDVLPAGTRFRSAKEVPNVFGSAYTPPHGLSCTASGTQVDCTGGALKGTYAAYGAPPLTGHTTGTPDNFTIEITAFAPAPFGPSASPNATASPILNQVRVDPDGTVAELNENNNLNVLETNVGIPPLGNWGTFNELTVADRQSNPASGSVAPNGTLDYTLTVNNWGSDPVTNVTVTDFIPAGARFRNVAAAPLSNGTGGFVCSFDSGAAGVTCANGALAASPAIGTPTSTDITIRLFAPPTVNAATTVYTNHAVVDPGNGVAEADETNNVSDVPLTVAGSGQNAFNELTVLDQQTNPASGAVAPNGTLEYTLTAKNSGSDPVSNVVVYDYIPQTARFRDVTAAPLSGGNGGFVCSFNAGLVTCAKGALAGGGSTQIKILLFAPNSPDDVTTHYTNHAVVDPDSAIPEANEDNNVSDAALTVALPPAGQNAYNDLVVTNVQAVPAEGSAVAPSGTLIYRLTVQNAGSDPATNVVVRDFLPAGTTFRSAKYNSTLSAGSSGFTCSQSGGIIECGNGSVGPMGSGGMAVVDITLFAPSQPGTINNQAVVDPDNRIPEANETNNTAVSADTTVALGGAQQFIELKVDSIQADPAPVGTDSPVTYTVRIKNDGSDQAFNVKVTDQLPQGSAFVSADDGAPNTSGAFSCTQAGGLVTCTGGSIPGGGSRDLKIIVRSPKQSDVTLVNNQVTMTNSAIVDPDNAIPEGDETNNGASNTITVLARVDLTVSNDGSNCADNPNNPGGCTWGFGVTNNGPDGVSNVVVRTDLPAGVTPLDVQAPDGWACQITINPVNQVTCSNGGATLASGASAQFNVHMHVSARNGDSLRGSTVVDPDNTIVETDETNNTASGTITVNANVDLSVTNDGTACSAGSAMECDWKVTVTNTGPGAVSGVVVRTDFPVGIIPLNVGQPPAGWACQITENPINQVTCTTGSGTLAGGATAEFSLHVYVTANTGSTISSSSIVDPDNTVVETDESNNTASSSVQA